MVNLSLSTLLWLSLKYGVYTHINISRLQPSPSIPIPRLPISYNILAWSLKTFQVMHLGMIGYYL